MADHFRLVGGEGFVMASLTISDFRGLSAASGATLAADDHLRQSLRDLLTTPIGSRVMRRDYGSRIPELVDAPMTPGLVADLVAATAEAVRNFEPRVSLKAVAVRAVASGELSLDLTVETNGRVVKLETVI